MKSNNRVHDGLSRRTVLGGIGAAGIASVTGLSATATASDTVPDDFDYDPHTGDTYGAIADAIVPRTPDLAAERGPEHEPGALDIDFQEYLIWTYNNAEELRTEDLSWLAAKALSIDLELAGLQEIVDDILEDHDSTTQDRLAADGLDDAETVFGSLRAISVDVDYSVFDDGPASAEYTIETTDGTVSGESVNYPLAPVTAAMFNVVALEFIAQDLVVGPIEPTDELADGGAFARLSHADRLNCLEWLFGGEPVGIRGAELEAFFPEPEAMVGIAFNAHTLTGIGYYGEWEAYGSTRTKPPSQRELEQPVDEVQSRQQTGYPGPAPGYAKLRGFKLDEFTENDY